MKEICVIYHIVFICNNIFEVENFYLHIVEMLLIMETVEIFPRTDPSCSEEESLQFAQKIDYCKLVRKVEAIRAFDSLKEAQTINMVDIFQNQLLQLYDLLPTFDHIHLRRRHK